MCICFLVSVGTCMCDFRRLTVYTFLNGFLHYMSQNMISESIIEPKTC